MSDSCTSSSDCFIGVEKTLADVRDHLKSFVSKPIDDVIADLEPLEKAKVQVSLAYTINALLYVHLKSHGVSSKDIRQTHVKQELDRVKAFVKKIKDTEDKAKAKGPTLTLDKEASKRFVHNALSSDQVYVEALERKKEREQEQEKKKETTPSKQKNCPNTGEKGSNSKRQRKK